MSESIAGCGIGLHEPSLHIPIQHSKGCSSQWFEKDLWKKDFGNHGKSLLFWTPVAAISILGLGIFRLFAFLWLGVRGGDRKIR